MGAVVLSGALLTLAVPGGVAAATPPGAAGPDLGPGVLVFDPSMPQSDIQAAVDAVARQQVDDEMGTRRYALLFKPGVYGSVDHPLKFQVGYYTEVAGLGRAPSDVTINGSVDVFNRCLAADNCIALDNFWRSMSNLTINPAGGSGCRTNTEFWAVSQAAPLRRVKITGNTTLMDYCTAGPQYASGGFIADSAISATVVSGSQQQFYTRNGSVGGWSNGVWNQVFSGVAGAPAQSFPSPPYTTLATTPASKEKPYLYVDGSGAYQVFVPDAARNSQGTTWQDGPTRGRSLPLSSFFVARPSDSVSKIDSALAQGRNLLLTPGVYDVAHSIAVKRAGTVVLGLGLATLTAQHGAVPLTVADVPDVDIAGLTVDAGPVESPALLRVGTPHAKGRAHASDPNRPTALQDVFFRVGGPHAGKAATSLVINGDHVILDDIWAWRADHGTGVGWTQNTAGTGVVVNGDDVTATGLFVEHYQKYNVVWKGERGRTVFFQNELPYDAPDQAAWRHGDVDGWAAYKVADGVQSHEAWGLGSYIYTNVNPDLHATNAFEVPVTPGVRMHDLLTVSLNKAGTIDHVINGVGAPVTPTYQGPTDVVSYP
ncbi:adenylyl cyclase [Actinoallomurus rhizosphaericola]|uniref:adenylyl cyclase n=1 Tax=Actinoallomurus rhizosphaericola TaxID=2952536 RepID=UPI002090B14E|nr:adenylyl cyclase [Actinoallomurus rhizosphaericola]MCO5994288.1 adenylyl cyclase [Actinoallomurus rhizosphaericola]